MKFCYCDESGTGDEPIAVMVGVIVDAQRMHVTKNDWRILLESLSRVVGKPVEEIHTRDFYAGNKYWRELPGEQRSGIITATFDWLKDRHHTVVFSSVEKSKFFETQKAGLLKKEVNNIWRFLGLHLLLSVQKAHQSLAKTKGHTLFIFDNEERERIRFTDLVADPPAWTDSYYNKEKKQTRLNQVIDVPYFGDSTEVHLLQVADFLAFFLRRYAEIEAGYSQERYEHEAEKIKDWLDAFKSCCLEPRFIYPAMGRCECADMFYQHAPSILTNLNRT